MSSRDAHTHLAAGAVDLADLDLRATATAGEVVEQVAEAVRRREAGSWIRGWGWTAGGGGELDRIAPAHPVFLARRDGHAAWINRPARAACGLPPGPHVLDEAAFELARARLPAPTAAARLAAMSARAAEFAAKGVSRVDDFVERWAPELYARLRDQGELPVAIGMWLPESVTPADAEGLRQTFPYEAERVAVRGIKIFLDGTLGARTAALSRAYADHPSSRGVLRIAEHEIGDRILRWADRGWPVAVHAIGDRAVTLALNAFERAPKPRIGAHRIEHAQVVKKTDLPRFARTGVVASLQPGHWRDDLPFLAARLGTRPDVVAHPLGSLARAGAAIVFGSDWPVSSFDPAAIVDAAVDPMRGDEALTRDAARAYPLA